MFVAATIAAVGFISLVGLILFAPTKLSHVPESSDPHQRLLRDFDLLVFNRLEKPFWWSSTSLGTLRKWNSQILFFIDGSKKGEIENTITTNINSLQSLTKLDFRPAQNLEDANLKIYVLRTVYGPTRPKESEASHGSACDGSVQVHSSEIVEAKIFIDVDYKREVLESCIEEMLARILGFSIASSEVTPSIFNNNKSRSDHLTARDKALIKLLYDSQLKPRAKRRDALRLARLIIMQTYTAEQAAQLSEPETSRTVPR